MPDKRKSSMSVSSPKRPRISYEDEGDDRSSVTPYDQPRNHPVYGQKSAFPGLDDGGDGLFYGPAEDGMEYLRMVRSEANSLPALFVAPIQAVGIATSTPNLQVASDTQHTSLSTGFFADEAYVAPADDADDKTVAHPNGRYPAAQNSYYNLLRHRFRLLQSTLRCAPPAAAIAALDDSHPISLPRTAGAARKEWRHLLLTVDPQMVQLACMDLDTVLGVLQITARMLSDNVRGENAECIRRTGAWAWGLLGKCREVGQLATEEVGEIRDLGKRAAKILQKVREAQRSRTAETAAELSDSDAGEDIQPGDAAHEQEEGTAQEEPQEEADGHDADMRDVPQEQSAELEAAKARLQAQLPDSVDTVETVDSTGGDATNQARAMLDMILTVVGEFYGQRDLLDAREIWTS